MLLLRLLLHLMGNAGQTIQRRPQREAPPAATKIIKGIKKGASGSTSVARTTRETESETGDGKNNKGKERLGDEEEELKRGWKKWNWICETSF